MGPHEIVNGANGSVTWCQGPPFCPECAPAGPGPMPGTVHVLPMAGHCPGCRCQPSIRFVASSVKLVSAAAETPHLPVSSAPRCGAAGSSPGS